MRDSEPVRFASSLRCNAPHDPCTRPRKGALLPWIEALDAERLDLSVAQLFEGFKRDGEV
jgi:hypothetical protein